MFQKISTLLVIIMTCQLSIAQSYQRRTSSTIKNSDKNQDAIAKGLEKDDDFNRIMYENFQSKVIKYLSVEQVEQLRKKAVQDTVVVALSIQINKKGNARKAFLMDAFYKNLFSTPIAVEGITLEKFKPNKRVKRKFSDYNYINYDLLYVLKESGNLEPIPFETVYDIPRRKLIKNNIDRINLVTTNSKNDNNPEVAFYNHLQEELSSAIIELGNDQLNTSAINDVINLQLNLYMHKVDGLDTTLTRASILNSNDPLDSIEDALHLMTFEPLFKTIPSNLDYYSSTINIFYKLSFDDQEKPILTNLPIEFKHDYYSYQMTTKPVDNHKMSRYPKHPHCDEFSDVKEAKKCLSKELNIFISKNYIINKQNNQSINENMSFQFFIDKKGEITVISAHGFKNVKFAEEAIRVINEVPSLTPALNSDGELVRVLFTLPVKLRVE
ncbi:hypothetical protein LY01_00020 [Nonlabens xylanidelens]|uniref:TonB-like protein n=1 Tax=Nonlabens xylanidelens TaxID=191564 RepID=A0A2S6IQ27_9FLAO|nr:hypothetical protein [Nonlabens xylanidelens]PPK96206.1 hypothetical protein LY01_00020 [Nonlabens xylanidelens]PQJ17948.1 hypothetical protein BST94_07975 [Nonlabens xylanidelens]